jgi:hypothetical protein
VIVMPAMAQGQEAAWYGLLDLYEAHPEGWTLIGGQLVHLHCAERGFAPQRPTDDADAVVNARSAQVLGAVTTALRDLEFAAGPASADGIQYRWTRGDAVIDVLIPDGMGERAEKRPSVSGFPTIAAPGGTQALARSRVVEVQVGTRGGRIPRPDLVGALILKAKARIDTVGPDRDRHCDDFAVLVAMLGAADLRGLELTKGERKSRRKMMEVTRENDRAMRIVPDVRSRLDRLAAFIG